MGTDLQHRRAQANTARAKAALTSPAIPLAYRDVEMQERLCLVALQGGYARPEHWNELAECINVLRVGAGHRREDSKRRGYPHDEHQAVMDLCDEAQAALRNISAREQKTGKFGVSGDECRTLCGLLNSSAAFWPAQPQWLFRECVKHVRALTKNAVIVTPRGQS